MGKPRAAAATDAEVATQLIAFGLCSCEVQLF